LADDREIARRSENQPKWNVRGAVEKSGILRIWFFCSGHPIISHASDRIHVDTNYLAPLMGEPVACVSCRIPGSPDRGQLLLALGHNRSIIVRLA
jgi:hypothetical protein